MDLLSEDTIRKLAKNGRAYQYQAIKRSKGQTLGSLFGPVLNLRGAARVAISVCLRW